MSKHSSDVIAPLCRCCLKPVHVFWQPDLMGHGRKCYVHCKTPNCPLYYATRQIDDWMTMDLSQWNAAQHPNWSSTLKPQQMFN
jgi:hypothetical protein